MQNAGNRQDFLIHAPPLDRHAVRRGGLVRVGDFALGRHPDGGRERKLVAASTWPFVQVQISNANPDAKLDLQFSVVNTGVGPAKIESFEVFWKGKPYRSASELLHACCGYTSIKATLPQAKRHTPLTTGTVQGVVLRAGEPEMFIHYPLNTDNLAVWSALDNAREQMTYRICYCSVLDECWLGVLRSELYIRGQLHPKQVKTCPVPPVAYTQ
jgi:hypothetical protein